MRKLLRLAALAAILGAGLAMPTPAHAGDGVATQRFYADSGDDCRYGSTDGTLSWRVTWPPYHVLHVEVAGRVADRPLPADPGWSCRDDRYYSVVTFTAYSGSTVVDQESRRADNGVVSFAFTLGRNSAASRLDRVVVQVCRHPLYTLPPSYCGRAVEYRPPVITGESVI